MPTLDPSILLEATKAYLALCIFCALIVLLGFYLEQRAHNRQLCRRQQRLASRYRTVEENECIRREAIRACGGSYRNHTGDPS